MGAISALVKLIAVVENSCKILHFNNLLDQSYADESRFGVRH